MRSIRQITNPTGIDRLIKALIDNGIGPNSNVYAELGSTWNNLMVTRRTPDTRWASCSSTWAKIACSTAPTASSTAYRKVRSSRCGAFIIPQSMQDQYGYPALTPAVRSKIFGLNAASVYGVDPAATRYVIRDDDVERLRIAYREDPRSVPMPNRYEYVGPRTRREFLACLSRGDHPKLG